MTMPIQLYVVLWKHAVNRFPENHLGVPLLHFLSVTWNMQEQPSKYVLSNHQANRCTNDILSFHMSFSNTLYHPRLSPPHSRRIQDRWDYMWACACPLIQPILGWPDDQVPTTHSLSRQRTCPLASTTCHTRSPFRSSNLPVPDMSNTRREG